MPVVQTAELFRPLHEELVALLRGLAPGDWERPTIAPRWQVRDVAAHLLDGDLRKLSLHRDGHTLTPPHAIESYADLVRFLNDLNAEWVDAARRLSPRMIVELLSVTGPQVAEFVASLPPHGAAPYSVAWAGEEISENWFDTGREYTERWHHQMQIRDAVGAPGLLARRWLFPLLDLSLRALPHAYRNAEAPDGTAVVVEVPGGAGGTWSLVREGGCWELWRGENENAATRISADPDVAWRLLYNALPAEVARRALRVEGDPALAEPLISVRSVMV